MKLTLSFGIKKKESIQTTSFSLLLVHDVQMTSTSWIGDALPYNGGSQDCAFTNADGEWNDQVCTQLYPVVCMRVDESYTFEGESHICIWPMCGLAYELCNWS